MTEEALLTLTLLTLTYAGEGIFQMAMSPVDM